MQFRNEAGEPLYLFDRSRLEAADKCGRLYYWLYAFLGLGIVKQRAMPEWALLTGTYTHAGIEAQLRGAGPREAATHAAKAYMDEVGPQLEALDLGDRKELTWREFSQQLDLVVAL